MRIGYAKLGRSWQLDPQKASTVGGDIDVVRLLRFLSSEHPQHEFILVGRNTGQVPQKLGYSSNVSNPWTGWKESWWMPKNPADADKVIDNFRELSGDLHTTLDAMIVWAGQHGSANSRIPMIGTDWLHVPVGDKTTGGSGSALATPQFAFMNYCSWLLDFISRWREHDIQNREEIWLVPDPRNYLKCRELRWPLVNPVLAQFNMTRQMKHERYGRFHGLIGDKDGFPSFKPGKKEESVWVTGCDYIYAGLELTALPRPSETVAAERPGEHEFGIVINENRKGVPDQRLDVMRNWVTRYWPDTPIYGKWSDESQKRLNRTIEPVEYKFLYDRLRSFRSTFTTPASGSGWATSKPWECFAAGSICFFHPRYDVHGSIIPKTVNQKIKHNFPEAVELSDFLRVNTPEQLRERVEAVKNSDELWDKISKLQRTYYERAWEYYRGGARHVEERLGILKSEIDDVTYP